ncbi:MAG: hypothetical protein J7577_17145 [Sphingobacteriaceae bacterium]|nr:hypothetical protein [Sphingobacteriaceae bacterium]
MKYKYKIKRTLKIQVDLLERKIEAYLANNGYRIIERGPGYITFTENKFSDRKKSRYDFHTRIGEGKFIFKSSSETETYAELIYFTSMVEYMIIVMLVCLFGIYARNIIMPIIFSIFLTLPLLFKIVYQNEHVFEEIVAF